MTNGEFPLSGRELNNWLRTAGQGFFLMPGSGADRLAYLASQGIDVPSSTYYRIQAEIQSRFEHTDDLRNYDPTALIPAAWHDQEHGLELSTAFLYRVSVTGVDPTTGLPATGWYAIASDEQMTPNQVTDRLGSLLSGEGEAYKMVAETYTVTEALAQPGLWG
jgi:hypothetical protein